MKELTIPPYKISVCCPCFMKPQRTIRAIESVLNQDINDWEALFIGDGCPQFERFMDDGTFSAYSEKALENGNEMHFINLKEHKGGWGYAARNVGFRLARGQYIVFLDNDDVIATNHFRNYLSEIENTDADMVYFNSYIDPIDTVRESELRFGCIGHSEIIVKTELLKNFIQKPEYGHDWAMIEHLIRKNALIRKSNNEPTYIVKEIGGGHPNRERLTEKNID
jgi:glycosyltransferase involved in cell wall biosynthesis